VADRALTGVLLVGGGSRRFGSPKARAELGGETLAERAWRLLGDVCDERLAVGHSDGLPFATLEDAVEGGGPLAGLVAGLRAAAHDVAIVIPVDMPLLTPRALRLLADACRDAAIPQTGPLPGAYAKRALPLLEESLAAGELALSYVVSRLETTVVELDEALLANVNEREDLERLRRRS
jgi:molybdopterin-guanine dinucleotide biosynthesis protein A